ncbi:MAG: MarR family winged helix-turn-helix transcriptional regulator [Gaiellaceae bacterium]
MTVDLAEQLRPLLLRLNRELRRELSDLGVSGSQAALLHVIHARSGVGVADLALQEKMSAPAVSAHLDRLERAGLVRRVRSESDRRRVGLELTQAGSALLRRIRSRRTAWLANRLGRLGPDEREAIIAALPPLTRLLERTP